MKEFKRILFQVDLSESSAKIVPYVQTVAKKIDAKIHILFVARVFDYFTGIYVPVPSITSMEKDIIDGAERRLDEFVEQYFRDYPDTITSVVSGDAADMIIEYITSNEINLVIMGTHGRKGLDKVIFGSVAGRVVKTAPVPVMVVNPHKTDEDTEIWALPSIDGYKQCYSCTYPVLWPSTLKKFYPVSIENLDKIFQPKSIAVVGANERDGSVGAALMRNLIERGFSGDIFPINPNHNKLWEKPVCPVALQRKVDKFKV